MQQPKVVSLHSIMSNIKRKSKQTQDMKRKKSFSYSTHQQIQSEGQSIVLNDVLKLKEDWKDEQIFQIKQQHESLCRQLCDIFETVYQNDEELILHIYSTSRQWRKDKAQYQQQEEVNNKVIQHYKLLLQQSNEIVVSQEEKLLSQEELLISLTQQIRDNNMIKSINTSHQERQFLEKIESLQSQIDKFRNESQLTTFRRNDSLENESKLETILKMESPENQDEEIIQFVNNTFSFYKAIGNQQIASFIDSQYKNEQLSLTFNWNQINNEIIKVLINKFDLDNDIEQELQQLTALKAIKSFHNPILQSLDQLAETVIIKLQNYKKNEISRVMIIQQLVNLKRSLLKKL